MSDSESDAPKQPEEAQEEEAEKAEEEKAEGGGEEEEKRKKEEEKKQKRKEVNQRYYQKTKEKAKINVVADLPFSKRYLKYLTKKYLKKQQLRDYLRVVASNASTYELKYFKINSGDEEA